MRDRLDEYLDGLMSEDEARALEAALEADSELRDELERARRFRDLVEGLGVRGAIEDTVLTLRRRRDRRAALVRVGLGAAAALAAALLVWLAVRPNPAPPGEDIDEYVTEWREFGRRLGTMAADRRAGRVPKIGLGDLEVPPAKAFGVVFRSALDELDVNVEGALDVQVHDAVRAHFVSIRKVGEGLEGECRRAEASLDFFRRLRRLAGSDVANAFYDVFRPGLADLGTARRVRADVIVRRLDPQRGPAYLDEYEEAIAVLSRRYGPAKVRLVLERLAPADRRMYWRDAVQDGAGRDAVLAIRARVYRAACDAGADKLYVPLG